MALAPHVLERSDRLGRRHHVAIAGHILLQNDRVRTLRHDGPGEHADGGPGGDRLRRRMTGQAGIDHPPSLRLVAAHARAIDGVAVHRRRIEGRQVHRRENRLGDNPSSRLGKLHVLTLANRVNKPLQTSDRDIDI